MIQWHGAKSTNNSTTIFWDPPLLQLLPLPRLWPSYSGLLSLLVPPQLPPPLPSPTPMAPLPLPPTFHHAPSTPNKQPSVVNSTVGPAAAQKKCQFLHICNKADCGSRKLPCLPVPESTSAVIFHGKCLKVSWIGAVSSWGVESLSYSSISWRSCLNLAAWYSWGAISFLRFWISCRDSIWKVWWS